MFGLTQSGTQPGVYGQAAGGTPGIGVEGYAGGGVRPIPRTNVGVVGTADGTGTGGYFRSDTGEALHVTGRAVFQRSGVASVPANRPYVDVTVPGGLSASAGIVATLQRRRGSCAVVAVRRNYPGAGKARIYLTKVASTSARTDVAWFVFG